MPEQKPRLALLEQLQLSLGVGLPIEPTVPVKRDRIVPRVNDHHVNQLGWRSGFFWATGFLSAAKEVAASHPVPGLDLSKDNRIEELVTRSIQAYHANPPLLEASQGNPGFQRLLTDILLQRTGPHAGAPAIQDQSAITDNGPVQQLTVMAANTVPGIAVKAPSRIGRRKGRGRAGSSPTLPRRFLVVSRTLPGAGFRLTRPAFQHSHPRRMFNRRDGLPECLQSVPQTGHTLCTAPLRTKPVPHFCGRFKPRSPKPFANGPLQRCQLGAVPVECVG